VDSCPLGLHYNHRALNYNQVDSCPLLPDAARRPLIVADAEFGRLPLLGHILVKLGAVFVRRTSPFARGQKDAGVRAVAAKIGAAPLAVVFVEGRRSRDRRELQPKSGLIQELLKTGECQLLPATSSHELLPESDALERELAGEPRRPLSLKGLLLFMADAGCGRVQVRDRG
jgi:1-acyl-sn-glycerol-3-phosphate acyltransferase